MVAEVLFGRGNPSPNPFGLCRAGIGSAIPLPSRPRPVPGVQPIFWSIRFPMLFSRIGWAFSPTNPAVVGPGKGAAFLLRLISPVHRDPKCMLVCLLAVFTEQFFLCPLSARLSLRS